MKDFLSIEKFKELRFLFFLELLMGVLLATLISINKYQPKYWDWKAFAFTISVLSLSCLIDKKLYFNLATFLGVGSFLYLLAWFAFNLIFNFN